LRLGDGSRTSTEVNPVHTYNAVGSFTVMLTATNAYGEDTATGTVQVTSYALYLPVVLRNY
jgi:PKD repeat protein